MLTLWAGGAASAQGEAVSTDKSEERRVLFKKAKCQFASFLSMRSMIVWHGGLTVFFLAKSPEAPRTMMTVLSLSSRLL